MHFVIAVGLRIVVDIVFQFHCKWCFDYCSKLETEKRLFLWETVKAIITRKRSTRLYNTLILTEGNQLLVFGKIQGSPHMAKFLFHTA